MQPRPTGPDSTTRGAVSREQRWTRANPCPICGGHPGRPRGKRERCFGFRSEDGRYAHCTREEFAGSLLQNLSSGTYAHRLEGDCDCGTSHGLGQLGRSTAGSRGEGVRKAHNRVLEKYDYCSKDGTLLFQVERLEPKSFRQRRPDGNGGWIYNLNGVERVLYHLPELLRAGPDRPVYIPEGEKDVETLRELGFVATCNPGGAGKWSLLARGMNENLRGREVIILPDNDVPGHEHAEQVAGALHGVAGNVRILKLPDVPSKGDVSDWAATQRLQSEGIDPQQIDLEIQERLDSLAQQTPPVQFKDPAHAESKPAPGHQGAPTPDCPPLPDGVLPDLVCALDTRGWFDLYLEYAQAVSPMTPRMFHVSAGLWLPSTAIARRLVLRMPFGPIYPNLFVCWVAPTTRYRKTTALDVAKGIARRVFSHLMAPQETTPEAMLSDMAGAAPANLAEMSKEARDHWETSRNFAAQRGLILDEMSGLLAGAGKDYNAGLVEAYLRFYDCESEYIRSTRKQGRVAVHNAYVSLLGASTPAALAPHLMAERLWAMGWWPRFALLAPNTESSWQLPSEATEPPELADTLRRLMERLPSATWPHPPQTVSVTLGGGVFEAWSRYNRTVSHDLLTEDLDHRLWGTYGRLPVQVLKVASCLAAVDWRSASAGPVIEMDHVLRAIVIVEEWRASAHRVLAMAAATEYHAVSQRIVQIVARSEPNGATQRDICRAMRDRKPDDIHDALRQLVAAGQIELLENPSTPRGGRPTDRYRLARG